MTQKQILIVGAGFSGATVARVLAESGFRVLIMDQRAHVAGNAYDFNNEYGIRVHAYGPHLFHTNNQKVVSWLSRFTTWIPYKHRVKAILSDGRLVTLPVNKETIDIVGKENILDIFFRPYSKKMWGLSLEEIDPSVLARVHIRDDYNELYFPNDSFQALPEHGYTRMIENMLDHDNIEILLSTKYCKDFSAGFSHTFNSMPIDEYFDYRFGELPYRSIRFHTVNLPLPILLNVPVVNFTHDGPYTRITEWKNFPNHGVNSIFTTLTYEEPCDYKDNNFERYYPVKDIQGANRQIYKQYLSLVPPYMTFIGRCGLYTYLDMHQAISSSLSVSMDYAKRV